MAAKSSKVDTLLCDWATEKYAFQARALCKHERFRTERNSAFIILIYLEADVGRLKLAVADAFSAGDSALDTKADADRRVSKVAILDSAVSAMLLENFQVVRGVMCPLVFFLRRSRCVWCTLSSFSSVAWSRVKFVHLTDLLVVTSVKTRTFPPPVATTPLASGRVSPLGSIDGRGQREH